MFVFLRVVIYIILLPIFFEATLVGLYIILGFVCIFSDLNIINILLRINKIFIKPIKSKNGNKDFQVRDYKPTNILLFWPDYYLSKNQKNLVSIDYFAMTKINEIYSCLV